MMGRDFSVIATLFFKASSLQKKRAILTVAAIAWGTVAILMLLAFGEGLRNQMVKARRGMGENIAVWWSGCRQPVRQLEYMVEHTDSIPWRQLPAARFFLILSGVVLDLGL